MPSTVTGRSRRQRAHRLRTLLAIGAALAGFVLLTACQPAGPYLHVTATAPPATIPPGGTASSTVSATNTGDAPTASSTVTISYTRPGGNLPLTFTLAPGAACSITRPRYGNYYATCTVPPLEPKASVELATMGVTAPTSLPYTGYNASLTATGPNDSASASFKARDVGPANLQSSVYVMPSISLVDRPATATVTVADQGYSPAEGATTTVALPAGSVPGAVTAPAGTTCTPADHVVSCTTTSIGNGGSITLTVPFTTPPTPVAGSVVVDADVAQVVAETSEADNGSSASLDVRAAAAGVVPTVANPPTVAAGSVFDRTITLTNTGGATATAVTLADRFSTIGYLDATGSPGTSCTLATSYSGKPPTLHRIGANCAFGDLAPGEAKSVVLRVYAPGNATPGAYTDYLTASTTAFSDPLISDTATGTTNVVIPSVPDAPTNLTPPTFTGDLNTGSVVTGTSTGTWLSFGTPSIATTWARCSGAGSCTPIPGATASTYTVQADDVGFALAYVVTATNGGGSTTVSSPLQGPVVAPVAPTLVTAPSLVPGLEKQPGFAWAVTTGTWSGTPTITYVYQWRRCAIGGGSCVDIPGATTSGYFLQADDVFHSVQVLVTATNTGGSASALSNLSGEIDPPDGP